MQKNRILILTLLLWIFLCAHLNATERLKVGIYNFKPLVFVDEQGNAKGFFADILNYIAHKEGWQIQYVSGSWHECLERLENNEIDLLGSIAYSEERAKKLDFTNEFLFLDWGLVYKQKNSAIETVFDLQNKTVSVLKSSIYTQGFKNLLEQFGIQCNLLEKDEYTDVFQSVHDKEADAGINTNVYGILLEGNYNIQRTQIVFSPVKIRFAVKKHQQTDILHTLNRYFADLKADKQSVYYELYNRWMGFYHKKESVPLWMLWIIFVFIGLFLVVIFFNMMLKKQVKLKTSKLSAVNEELRHSEEKYRLLSEKLHQREQQFRTLAENSPDVIARVDKSLRYLYINSAIEPPTGIPPEAFIGKTNRELGMPEDISRQWEIKNNKVLETGQKETIEFSFPTPDGIKHYQGHIAPEFAEDGSVISILAVTRDITALKKSEEALSREREKFFSVLEAIPAFVYLQAPDYSIRFFNRNFKEIFGDPKGRPCYEAAQGRTEPCEVCPTFRVFDTKQLEIWEYIHSDGRIFMIYDSYLSDIDATPLVLEMGVDITERRKMENELQKVKNYLDNIINSMPSVLLAVDAEERISLWNVEAEKVTGISAQHARGHLLKTVFPQLTEHMEKINETLTTRKPQKQGKVMFSSFPNSSFGTRETRYADITIYPLINNGVEGAVMRIDDVTARVRIEEMMIQTEKMMSVGGLAAGMAHEINNPLAGILQSIQNVFRRISPELPVNKKAADECGISLNAIHAYMEKRNILNFLEGIRESGERAAKIVANMLQFSHRTESKMSPMNLAKLLDRTIELASHDYDLKKKYDFRHIEIIREYESDMPEVVCTATEIEQVILNLLRNAAQAMSVGQSSRLSTEDLEGFKNLQGLPRIIIRLKKDSSMARIEVEDNGSGMDKNTKKRVFEPFFTTKDIGAGTGLGLSVSYFIITSNHKGSMSVESEAGKGTKFIIRLPL